MNLRQKVEEKKPGIKEHMLYNSIYIEVQEWVIDGDFWTGIVGEITGKGHEVIFSSAGKVLNVHLGNCDRALFLRFVYFIYAISHKVF